VVRLLLWFYSPLLGDQPAAKTLPTHRTIQTHTDIHVSVVIRTNNPNIGAGEDSSCLRQRSDCDQKIISILTKKYVLSYSFEHLIQYVVIKLIMPEREICLSCRSMVSVFPLK
jgi:hypothetical protein